MLLGFHLYSTLYSLVVVIVQYLDVSAPRLRFISLQMIDSERLSKELMEQIDDPWSRSIIINTGSSGLRW